MADQIGQVINNFAAGYAETWSIDRCRELRCPTSLMMGLDSPSPSQRVTEMLAENIPGSRLQMFHGAGHLLPMTDPHLVDPMISRHIRDAETAEIVRTALARLPQAA